MRLVITVECIVTYTFTSIDCQRKTEKDCKRNPYIMLINKIHRDFKAVAHLTKAQSFATNPNKKLEK